MNNLFLLFLEASLLVQTVIIILILASIYSWSLIITKNKIFKSVIQETINFEQKYYSGADIGILFDRIKKKTNKTPIEVIFCEGLEELSDLQEYAAVSNETIEKVIYRAMNIEIVEQITKLEKNLASLATIGSISPFIGLLGTVWGIMNSFQSLATNTQNALSIVAPGISEALVATALGLIAAIPAVLFYNKFIAQLDKLTSKYENFSEHLIKVLQKQYLIDKDAL
ncbi:MAG: protein TolQ [Pseudomonadota bacterium]|jgi:biopolymer transport protein TolQ|nr:protein TolQ [Pseudomonadota bacterium]|tara:strand:- start:619 stop:1296 length:678 start_codon:yes stop_codon:yes gene_type:complete